MSNNPLTNIQKLNNVSFLKVLLTRIDSPLWTDQGFEGTEEEYHQEQLLIQAIKDIINGSITELEDQRLANSPFRTKRIKIQLHQQDE